MASLVAPRPVVPLMNFKAMICTRHAMPLTPVPLLPTAR
jgi:hypothetical protein